MPCIFLNKTKPAIGSSELELGTAASVLSDFRMPFYHNYDHGVFMYIYPQSEVGIAKTITGIAVYILRSGFGGTYPITSNNQRIKICHTSDSEFAPSTKTDLTGVNYTNLTTCKGNFTFTTPSVSADWVVITLDTNFSYDGTSGLIIIWENEDGSYIPGTGSTPQGKITTWDTTFRFFHKAADGTYPTSAFGTRNSTQIGNYKLIYS
jgi:hypothetical protein